MYCVIYPFLQEMEEKKHNCYRKKPTMPSFHDAVQIVFICFQMKEPFNYLIIV